MKKWQPARAILLTFIFLLAACNGDETATPTDIVVAADLGIGYDYPDGWFARDNGTTTTVSTFAVSPEEEGDTDHTLIEIQMAETNNIIPPGQTLTSYVATARDEFGPSFAGSDISEIDGREAAIIILQGADSVGIIAFISNGPQLVIARGSTQVLTGVPSIGHEDFRELEAIVRSIRFIE